MINMANGVINNLPIYKEVFTIPEASVQVMDTNAPFTLIDPQGAYNIIPIYCYFYIASNNTIPYTGANHIHLDGTGNLAVPGLVATYSLNAGIANSLYYGPIYNMLVNFQTSPNRFGGLSFNTALNIFFDTAPTAGDGDMVVNLFYTINDLF